MRFFFRIIVTASIFLFSFSTSVALAATGSGACSWHNGVNCEAGADFDGSVICYDGWRDSSVSYRDVCSDTCPYGYTDEFKNMILNCFRDQDVADNELQTKLELLRKKADQVRREAYLAVVETPDEWLVLSPEQQRQLRNQDTQMYIALLAQINAAILSTKDQITQVQAGAKLKCEFLDSTSYLYCRSAPVFVVPSPVVVAPQPVYEASSPVPKATKTQPLKIKKEFRFDETKRKDFANKFPGESKISGNLRKCPSTSGCDVVRTLDPKTKMDILGSYNNEQWFLVSVASSEPAVTGWVHSSIVKKNAAPEPTKQLENFDEVTETTTPPEKIEKVVRWYTKISDFFADFFKGNQK